MGGCYGKVHEITPFLTLLKEIKGDHETGEIITFPNKVVFEQEIRHFSKYNGFVNKEFTFLIREDTDTQEAKKLLLGVVDEVLAPEKEEYKSQIDRLIKTFLITKEETEPVAWVEHNDHGMSLRGRFLVRLSHASFTKNKVEEGLIKKIQQSDRVQFHFTDSGRNQQGSSTLKKEDRDSDHFH